MPKWGYLTHILTIDFIKKKNDYIFLVLMIHKKPHLEKRLPGMLLFVKDDGKRIKSGSKRDQRKNLQTP